MSLFVKLISFLQLGAILANGRETFFNHINILSDEMIDEINQLTTTWNAGRNFDIDTPIKHLYSLLHVKRPLNQVCLPLKVQDIDIETGLIPTEFDARKHWPNCPSISFIPDQGECGSCWAVAATEVMSDRICIHSNGTKQVSISAQHLTSCCTTCGDGCDGGDTISAWKYYKTDGIVSGGHYNSHQGCQPYLLPECSHMGTVNGTRPLCVDEKPTPPCSNKCETGYNVSFNDDKHYASHIYSIENNVTLLQYEIMENGPVEAELTVYMDFFHYKSGVYQQLSDDFRGYHAVKILGWGVENGTPYWLCANSWNDEWGDNGYFKIRRDTNECDIMDNLNAGIPLL